MNDSPSPDQAATDRQWCSEIFEQHQQRLAAYASGLLNGDRHRVFDAVQETFLRLCKQPRDRVCSHVQAWLFRTCRNLIIDQFRQDKRMEFSTTKMLLHQGQEPSVRADDRLVEQEDFTRCQQAISKLPPQQQEMLNLRMAQGLSYKQIAEVTGVSVNHVGVTLHQSIQRLRTELV